MKTPTKNLACGFEHPIAITLHWPTHPNSNPNLPILISHQPRGDCGWCFGWHQCSQRGSKWGPTWAGGSPNWSSSSSNILTQKTKIILQCLNSKYGLLYGLFRQKIKLDGQELIGEDAFLDCILGGMTSLKCSQALLKRWSRARSSQASMDSTALLGSSTSQSSPSTGRYSAC